MVGVDRRPDPARRLRSGPWRHSRAAGVCRLAGPLAADLPVRPASPGFGPDLRKRGVRSGTPRTGDRHIVQRASRRPGHLGPATHRERPAIGSADSSARAVPPGPLDGDDDLAAGAAFLDVADGCRGLAERVGPVDGGCDLSGLDEIPEDPQVLGVLRRDERTQLLAHQRGEQEGAELAVATAEPPPAVLAADDDEPAARGEGPAEVGQPSVASDVEDYVVPKPPVSEVFAV
jgi:hypothetical protein